MTLNRVNPVSGLTPQAPDGQREKLQVSSVKSASNATLRSFAQAGWISGRVTATTADGVYRVETKLGDLSINIVKNQALSLGSRLLISYDKESGKANYIPFEKLAFDVKKAAPDGAPGSSQTSQVVTMSKGVSKAIQASIATIADREFSLGSSPAQQSAAATKALSGTFPNTFSGASFPLAVALFPMVVRGGLLEGFAHKLSEKYGATSRLASLARKHALPPVPKVDLDSTLLSWQMPMFSQGEVLETQWEFEEQGTSKEDPANKQYRIFMEARFPFSGIFQVEMYMTGFALDVEVISEIELSDEVIRDIQEVIYQMSLAFSLEASMNYLFGAEYLKVKKEN